MTKSLTQAFPIRSYNLNPRGFARFTTMANFFQEMAYAHANQLGFGYRDLHKNKTMWVLCRMRILMHRYPEWGDQVNVETWHRGMDRLFGLRDFSVTDHQGNELGLASSAWLILDATSRRPVRASNEMLQEGKAEKAVFNEPLQKIKLPDNLQEVGHRHVVFSDLDIMGHVNNVKYMEWSIDAILTGGSIGQEISELEINFTNEARLGDEITINGNQTLHFTSGPDMFFQAMRVADGKEIFRVRLRLN